MELVRSAIAVIQVVNRSKMDQLIKTISQLHPAAQVAAIIGVVLIVVVIWQAFKAMRDD